MAYLSKSDEEVFINLYPNAIRVLDVVVEELLSIKGTKTELYKKMKKQRDEILSSMEGIPPILSETMPEIAFVGGKGFYFDVPFMLSQICCLYTVKTQKGKELDFNKLNEISDLYYYGKKDEYIKEMHQFLVNIKQNLNEKIRKSNNKAPVPSINDFINKTVGIQLFNFDEKKHNQLIQNRNAINWFIRNLEVFISAFNEPLTEEIMSYFDQDKILLFISHVSISEVVESIKSEKEIQPECIKLVQLYGAYANYRRKQTMYNISYNYKCLDMNQDYLISTDSILIQNANFRENLEEYNGRAYFSEEELLNFLPDLKREVKIKEFRKDIELSWEFLPEKQKETTGKRIPILKYSKTDEEKKELEDKKEQLLEEKIELFASLPYISSLKGMNRFEGYVAYLFENGRVVLEKFYKKTKHGVIPTFNEAIYVMNITDFKELSKMGKTEIREYAKDMGLDVKVINHTKNFKQRVLNEVNSTSYNENVIDFIDDLVSSAKRIEELRK